jgi:hypothetical protein
MYSKKKNREKTGMKNQLRHFKTAENAEGLCMCFLSPVFPQGSQYHFCKLVRLSELSD